MKHVLVTGASGYIAKHIVLKLLQAGYQVRGSVRSLSRGEEVRAAVRAQLNPDTDLDHLLSFVELDLTKDAGWDAALADIDVLMHTASPFPLELPNDENDLIRPAVDGTLRALRAAKANNVKRVVLTSSTAAVVYRDPLEGDQPFDESHWTDLQHPACSSYSKSKTLAEKAAWKFVAESFADCQLTCINPGFVLGPPLDEHYGSSMQVIARLLSGKDPAVPQLGFASVDVRDVATIHVNAIDNSKTAGLRILAVSGFLWFSEIAKAVAAATPERKISTRQAPNWLMKLLALFDKQIRGIVPNLGIKFDVSNQRAKQHMDIDFIDPRDSAVEAARYLIDHKLA